MPKDLSQLEERLRRALLREMKRQHKAVSPDRVDVIKKTWFVSQTKTDALLIEGRLERNVWSGDIEISFRRFNVKL